MGTGRRLKDGSDMAVLTLGPIGHNAAEAIAELEKEQPGRTIAHYDMRFVKPLDEKLLKEVAERYGTVVTVEDGVRNGGFGSAVLEWLSDHGYNTKVTRLGLPDTMYSPSISQTTILRATTTQCQTSWFTAASIS